MTCNDALRALLDADLEAVAAEDASPLGLHVANCARCRAVLSGLRADTARLATVAARHPVPTRQVAPRAGRPSRWSFVPIPLAMAAVLAFIVLTQTIRPRATISVTEAPASGPAPAAKVVTSSVVSTRARADLRTGRIAASRLPPPTPLETVGPLPAQASAPTPVQVDPVVISEVPATVAVATAGGRAVVLRPSNANITVVWFY